MARGKRAGTRAAPPELTAGTGAPKPPVAAPGGGYGDRQQAEGQAATAPMYDDQQQQGGQAPPVPIPPGPMPDAFAPSGTPIAPSAAPPGDYIDPTQVLEAIYEAYPSPWIRSLIDR